MTTTPPPSRPDTTPLTNPRRAATPRLSPDRVHEFVKDLLGEDVHATRVLSFARGVVGVLHAAALGIHAIGRGLADAMGLDPKHAIKQVVCLLSNAGITVWQWFGQWVMFVVAARTELLVALDWTEFDKDDQATIALYLVTSHGRATPLLWKTVRKSELKNRRNDHEAEVIERLHEILPKDIEVTVLADRGFGDQRRIMYLETLGWSYAIRFRQIIQVTHGGRSLLLSAIAQALLSLLGAAGEACGLDRTLKANTVKTRQMSLFNQGCHWYSAILDMREDRLLPLMKAFGEIVSSHSTFREILGLI